MEVTRSTSYRHLMALMGKAGIQDKVDRLRFASRVLRKKVDSYTTLGESDIELLLDTMRGWESAQEIRFANGTISCETAMTLEWMNNPDMLMLSDKSFLPDAQSRRKFMEKNKLDVTQENYKINDDFDAIMDKALSGLSTGDAKRLTTTDGRWEDWKVIPTPTASMGLAMGIGGIPRGKMIQLWGKKHAGKSMLSYSIIAEAQKAGIKCVLIDAEAAATGDFIDRLGVDTEELRVVRPRDLEELCTILRRLAASGFLIVVDSIAASQSSIELERNLKKEHARVGGNAMLWSATLAILRAELVEHGTTVVLINQVRAKMDKSLYEDPDKPWGAESIQHNIDISMKVAAVTEKNPTLKENGYKISRCYIDKNRFSGDSNRVDLHFKPGFPYNRSLDLVRACGEEVSKGSGITYGEMADNVLLENHAADDNGELISKNSRWAIRIDPLMMAAIQVDDEDFAEVDIEPLADWDQVTVPPIDKENSSYFTIPRVGVIPATRWLREHPTARMVIEQRMLDGLNNKRTMITDM